MEKRNNKKAETLGAVERERERELQSSKHNYAELFDSLTHTRHLENNYTNNKEKK